MKKTIPAVLLAVLLASSCQEPGATDDPDPATPADIKVLAAFTDRLDALTLTCGPPGGTHPDPAAACRALDEAGGDPERLSDLGISCAEEHDPVWVSVEGTWGETAFQLGWNFGNTCEAKDRSGGLVDLM